MASIFDNMGNTGLNSLLQPIIQLFQPIIQLFQPILNMLGPIIVPLEGVLSGITSSIINILMRIPFGNITVSVIQPLTGILSSVTASIPRVPGASSVYQSNPSAVAAYAPPWWDNFASYIALWGWPLLLKRIPGRGYRVLADTEGMEKGGYDQPAYQQGMYQPVVGG